MANTKLTDAQRVVLAAAAARETRLVLPLPASLGNNRGTHGIILKSLLERGLVSERTAQVGEEVWRADDEGGRVTLTIANAGFDAIGIEGADDDKAWGAGPGGDGTTAELIPTSQPAETHATEPRAMTKLAALIAALHQPPGATISDLMQATGWQAHSVRGAISGNLKKKLGLNVVAEPIEGRGRVYRIAAAESAA